MEPKVEILCNIFRYLEIKDLLKCREVCRLFKAIVERRVRIKSLAICEESNRSELGVFFYSNHAINDGHIINRPRADILLLGILELLTSQLKRLYVDYRLLRSKIKTVEARTGRPKVSWYLNSFQQIEQLQLDNFQGGGFELNLANLRILFIKSSGEPVAGSAFQTTCKLRIACKNLSVFKATGPLSEYEFKNPEQIKNLDTERFEGACLAKFVSVERLFIHDGDSISVELFGSYEHLKELHLRRVNRPKIAHLINRRNQMGARFVIYLMGVRVDAETELGDYYPNQRKLNLPQQTAILSARRDSFTKSVNWVEHLNYSEILKQIQSLTSSRSTSLWSEFFGLFANIRSLCIVEHDVKLDERCLLAFVKSCKVLNRLRFENVTLETWFFDELYLFTNYITQLVILEHTLPVRQSIVLDHKYLREFYIRDPVEIQVISRAFDSPSLRSYGFFHNGIRHTVTRKPDRTFILTIAGDCAENEEEIHFEQIAKLPDILIYL